MNFFNLPKQTKIDKVIPKNSFHKYANMKQKRMMSDLIKRITWTNKFTKDSINLSGKKIDEIEVFRIELREKAKIETILQIINRAIPYHIIIWIEYLNEAYISVASKHLHPTNNDIAVVDWTFESDWFLIKECPFQINLKTSLDAILKNLCVQITGEIENQNIGLDQIVQKEQKKDILIKKIDSLKRQISKEIQFNKKVELNLELKQLEKELKALNKL